MIRGAIFDVDGTLLQSMEFWDRAPQLYLKRRGLRAEEGLADRLFSMTMAQSAQYLKEQYRLPDSIQKIISDVDEMAEEFYRKEAQPKEGALEFLEELKERGIPMAVATSTDRSLIEAAFERLGMKPYFSGIFTCSEVGAGKDQPDIFLAAGALMNTEPRDTWVFEDGLYAVRTAKRAGFRTVGIYDESSRKDQEQIKETADEYVTGFHQRRQLLERLLGNA